MWADPKYLRSWRDLRRRHLLFWFFVLGYVPGIRSVVGWLRRSKFLSSEFSVPAVSPAFLSSFLVCRPTVSKLRELQSSPLDSRPMNGIIAFALRMRALMVALFVLGSELISFSALTIRS